MDACLAQGHNTALTGGLLVQSLAFAIVVALYRQSVGLHTLLNSIVLIFFCMGTAKTKTSIRQLAPRFIVDLKGMELFLCVSIILNTRFVFEHSEYFNRVNVK